MSPRPTVRVVGLGPGGPELLTRQALGVLNEAGPLWMRTSRHPAAVVVPAAASFDELYEQLDTFEAVYTEIVERLVATAHQHGQVTYAVPGSPAVAERTVELLLADDRVRVEQIPALSFLDLAWTRLGVDPLAAGVTVVDGHLFAEQVAGRSGPFLVAQCDQPWVVSEIKLSVDDPDDSLRVTVVQHLGLPEERIDEIPWNELDRVDVDHLTSLWIAELPARASVAFGQFEQMVQRLRVECPWDAEQTHASLRKYLVEETYEVLDALEHADSADTDAAWAEVCEELGDVLYQVFFHAVIASERGHFEVADVATAIHDKLWRRHPHVFGDVAIGGTHDVIANWEAIKQVEKARKAGAAASTDQPTPSVLDGIPTALPAAMFAQKVTKKTAAAGFGSPSLERSIADVDNALAPFRGDGVTDASVDAGHLLMAAVAVTRHSGADAESALRDAAQALAARFREVEAGLA